MEASSMEGALTCAAGAAFITLRRSGGIEGAGIIRVSPVLSSRAARTSLTFDEPMTLFDLAVPPFPAGRTAAPEEAGR
jgi:hypothetical protein